MAFALMLLAEHKYYTSDAMSVHEVIRKYSLIVNGMENKSLRWKPERF